MQIFCHFGHLLLYHLLEDFVLEFLFPVCYHGLRLGCLFSYCQVGRRQPTIFPFFLQCQCFYFHLVEGQASLGVFFTRRRRSWQMGPSLGPMMNWSRSRTSPLPSPVPSLCFNLKNSSRKRREKDLSDCCGSCLQLKKLGSEDWDMSVVTIQRKQYIKYFLWGVSACPLQSHCFPLSLSL